MERLQDSDEGVDSGAVSEQGRVLVHPQDHRALHQQGEPLGQQTVSAEQTGVLHQYILILSRKPVCVFIF